MSLIVCPECGKQISDQADMCIHCGFPINNKNRIFQIGTIIGYKCEKCNIPDAAFIVLKSNKHETIATCKECDTQVKINFDNIVLTEDEYESIYDDIYDNDIETATKKIVELLSCDINLAQEYCMSVKKSIENMERICNLTHDPNRREALQKIQEKNRQQKLIQDYQYRNNAVCPYCHSKNTKKISTTAKITNTVMFGIFGTKRHKQWHCNNCKSEF